MLKNYLKIAIRNLQKQKTFAFINICGLSIGIACFTLLLLYAYNELSFDKFNKNTNDIYRPYAWFNAMNGQPAIGYMDYSGPTAATLGEAMRLNLPDVINYVRIQLPYGESLIRTDKNVFRSNVTYADPSLFSIFSFPLKARNTSTALHTVNDVPENSTIKFDILGNFLFAEKYVNGSNFIGNDFHYIDKQTFVQLKPGSKLFNDTKQLQNFLDIIGNCIRHFIYCLH